MIRIQLGDTGPRVVLLQIGLSTPPLMRAMPFSMFDHADVDDSITALEPNTLERSLREDHQYGTVAAGDLAQAGRGNG
jgi:hypothetical protein